jgi:hypothetical protein
VLPEERAVADPDLSHITPELRPLAKPLDRYRGWPGNPKKHATADLRASFRDHGQLRPVLAWLGTGPADPADPPIIVAGHGFVEAMTDEGVTHGAVVEAYMPYEQARRFMLGDNRWAQKGGFDDDALMEMLTRMQGEPNGLIGTGYDDDFVQDQLDRMSGAKPKKKDGTEGEMMLTCPACGHTWSGTALLRVPGKDGGSDLPPDDRPDA